MPSSSFCFLLLEFGEDLVPEFFVEGFLFDLGLVGAVLKVDGAREGRGAHAHEAVDENSSGGDSVGVFDPSTGLRTGSWVVVGRTADVCEDGHEGASVVGDFENMLLDSRLEWRVVGG